MPVNYLITTKHTSLLFTTTSRTLLGKTIVNPPEDIKKADQTSPAGEVVVADCFANDNSEYFVFPVILPSSLKASERVACSLNVAMIALLLLWYLWPYSVLCPPALTPAGFYLQKVQAQPRG
jgi:hypothetical protein